MTSPIRVNLSQGQSYKVMAYSSTSSEYQYLKVQGDGGSPVVLMSPPVGGGTVQPFPGTPPTINGGAGGFADVWIRHSLGGVPTSWYDSNPILVSAEGGGNNATVGGENGDDQDYDDTVAIFDPA